MDTPEKTMNRLIVLGTAASVPDAAHDYTHMLVLAGDRLVLIDSGSAPLLYLERLGLKADSITDIVLTHFHPDHVSGIPGLIMGLWLLGRKSELTLHGLDYTLSRLETMMSLYNWQTWPDLYPIAFHRVPAAEYALVLDGPDLRIIASPGKHLIPSIGVRIEFARSNVAVAYSSDTEPSPEIENIARGADILIHEATGASPGHSSPEQAGQVAQQAGVQHLILVHYPTQVEPSEWIAQAKESFAGDVSLAQDGMVLNFD